ncbi:hypothetical protein GC163_22695 [bacterium]|nr:hypothetical protein [bacterium]
MPIPVRCSECGARSQYADRYAGETVACKACGADVDVPRSRAGGSGKGGKKGKKSSFPTTAFIVAGVLIGAMAMLGVAGVVLFAMIGVAPVPAVSPPNNQQAGQPAPPVIPTSSAPPANVQPDSAAGAAMPATPAAPAKTAVANTTPPATPGPTPSGFQQKATAAAESTRLTFQKSPEWKVTVDPPANIETMTSTKPLKVRLDPNNMSDKDVVYPIATSDCLAVKSGKGSRDGFDVYRLSTGAKTGAVPGVGYSSALALSPDGQYFAHVKGEALSVYDIKAKKSLGELATGDGTNKFRIAVLAFPTPDRLVAISQLERGVKVWELPSGKFITHIVGSDKFTGHTSYAFSPGGKYIAVQGDYLKHNVDIYALDDGQLVGSIEIEGQTSSIEVGALGFSADGSQLAVLYDVQSRGGRRDFSQFVVWDIAAGKPVVDFDLSPQLKDQLDPAYQLGRLQPFPSPTRWMVHGRGILDTNQQQLIYSYPKVERLGIAYPQRVMGDDWLVGVVADKGDVRLEVLKVDEGALATAAKSAAAGGLAIDADLPTLTASDYSQATDAVASEQWSAVADPSTAAPQFQSSYPLEVPGGMARELVISDGADARMAVRVAYQENFDDTKVKVANDINNGALGRGYHIKTVYPVALRTVVDLYSVSSGERLGRQELPFSGSLLSISPNGELGLIEHHRGEGRLDIFTLKGDGGHQLAWRPYRSADDDRKREVAFAAFLDDQRVGTVNSEGDLVVWNISNLQPVFQFAEARLFAVSPGRKQLAIVRGNILGDKDVALIDAQTGDGLGVVPLEGRTESLAFHPNGQWLAISHGNEANKFLSIVDVATGEIINRYPLPDVAATLQWVGDDYLLLGGQQLISRPMQAIVWKYTAPEAAFPLRTTSLQCTFATPQGKSWQIRSVALPHAELLNQLDASKLAEKALVKPGDRVSLKLNVGGDADLAALKTNAEKQVRDRLEKAKLTVADGDQPVQISVDINLQAGESRELSKMGDRNVKETVIQKTIQVQIAYRLRDKVLWSNQRRIGNLDGILFRLMPNETAQQAVDRNMRERSERMLSDLELPAYIFGDGAREGLGTSPLVAVK